MYERPTHGVFKRVNICTLTIASPGVVNYTAHGLLADTPIQFGTTGSLPTGISVGTTYFVKSPAADSFNVSDTAGGADIDFTVSQSGTQSYFVANATTNRSPSHYSKKRE